MTRSATLGDVVTAIEARYPPRWAEPGDPVGLVVGDPAATVGKILFAVDPVHAVVVEAVAKRADILVVHHPLLYRAVNSVAASSPKGRAIHDLISHGIGLYVAHTNADSPTAGVSESMAVALGLVDLQPLESALADPLDKLVAFVPTADAAKLLDELAQAGVGVVGAYERCAFSTEGEGTFRPGPGSNPTVGTPGVIEVVPETRLEMVLPRGRRQAAIEALRHSHPYEEPAFDITELALPATDRGTGRLGVLPQPMTLGEFADRVAAALPRTAVGARVAGDLDREVMRVAVVAGAGDFMLDAAREAGADAYVTSDLRHHPASEFREFPSAPALIDVPHWAAEWTWLPVADQVVRAELSMMGIHVETEVSRTCTDPWNYRAAGPSDDDRGAHPES